MEFNGWNSFEDLARACGYTNCNNNNNNNNNNDNTSNNNETNKSFTMGCCDIPNGFQSVNPGLFIIIGEILGNIIAGSIPLNVQAALGNWLVLVGQAIVTFNAQQLYFQQGPGRYFNPNNYNVDNQFCDTTQNNNSSNDSKNSNKNKDKNPDSNNNTKSIKDNADKIDALELRINQLTTEIEKLKNTI